MRRSSVALAAVFVLLLTLRNAFRHKLRTRLTVVGIAVAVVAFGLSRTVIVPGYAGSSAKSSASLDTPDAVSPVSLIAESIRPGAPDASRAA